MHLDISTVLARRGRYREAITSDLEGLRLFRAAGLYGVARALNSLGWDLAHLGNCGPQAIDHCREALRLLRGLGDRYGQSAASHGLELPRTAGPSLLRRGGRMLAAPPSICLTCHTTLLSRGGDAHLPR